MPHLGFQPAASKRPGFTIVEMLLVVVLVGILSALASVSLKTFNSKMKVRGSVDELRDAIQLAHSDAMTRRHNSGILVDVTNLRYLRFVDSSSSGASNGIYSTGERLIQVWTALPPQLAFYSVASSLSPTPILRKCDAAQTYTSGAAQSGQYSIVFRPDGTSWATFTAKLGMASTKDTFRLAVLPPTGYVVLEK